MSDGDQNIRRAAISDAPGIARMHVQSWHETYTGIMPAELLSDLSVPRRTQAWEDILRHPTSYDNSAVYLYEAEDALCGFGACGTQRDAALEAQGFDGELGAIYVLHQFQGKGIGRALMRIITNDLIERGFRGMSLWVLRENQLARRFYEKCGGEIVAGREDVRGGIVLKEVSYGWRDLGAVQVRNSAASLQ